MDLGTIAIVALIAGLAGGAFAAALVGVVEGMLRQRFVAPTAGRAWVYHAARPVAVPAEPATAHFAQPTATRDAGPFNDFNDRAKRVLALSQDEAMRMAHDYIGTEHLLLGLIREGDSVAVKALESLGVELGKARTAAQFIVGRGSTTSPAAIQLSPEMKSALASARDEARKLGHTEVGTEHLLIGLCREDGKGVGILRSLGVHPETVRAQVIATLNRKPPGGPLPI